VGTKNLDIFDILTHTILSYAESNTIETIGDKRDCRKLTYPEICDNRFEEKIETAMDIVSSFNTFFSTQTGAAVCSPFETSIFRHRSATVYLYHNIANFRHHNVADFRAPAAADFCQRTAAEYLLHTAADIRLHNAAVFRLRSAADFRLRTAVDFRLCTAADISLHNAAYFRLRTAYDFRCLYVPSYRNDFS